MTAFPDKYQSLSDDSIATLKEVLKDQKNAIYVFKGRYFKKSECIISLVQIERLLRNKLIKIL